MLKFVYFMYKQKKQSVEKECIFRNKANLKYSGLYFSGLFVLGSKKHTTCLMVLIQAIMWMVEKS